jgi:hypothetical protein
MCSSETTQETLYTNRNSCRMMPPYASMCSSWHGRAPGYFPQLSLLYNMSHGLATTILSLSNGFMCGITPSRKLYCLCKGWVLHVHAVDIHGPLSGNGMLHPSAPQIEPTSFQEQAETPRNLLNHPAAAGSCMFRIGSRGASKSQMVLCRNTQKLVESSSCY